MTKRAQEVEARRGAAEAALAELRAGAARAAQQHALLHKHLDLLRASQREAGAQMEADRQRYAQHLAELRGRLQQYEGCLAAQAAAAP